jgi:hypothetical protein
MRADFQVRAQLAVLVLGLGCHDEAPERFPQVEGGVCNWQSEPQCAGSDSMLTCVSRTWVEQHCTDVCAARGLLPSTEGCVSDDYGDLCACNDSCNDIPTACESETSLVECVDGQLTTIDCADVCAGLDPPRASEGCDDTGWARCSCTLAGTSCNGDSAPRCDSPDTLVSCADGAWTIEACRAACSEDEYGYCKSTLVDGALIANCVCISF